jgi:desulfoferrodoxin (superoxide reductase-like protein)
MKIRIAFDTPDAEHYVNWLKFQDHDAEIGRESCDEIDGNSTFHSETAREISERLWSEYCNSN